MMSLLLSKEVGLTGLKRQTIQYFFFFFLTHNIQLQQQALPLSKLYFSMIYLQAFFILAQAFLLWQSRFNSRANMIFTQIRRESDSINLQTANTLHQRKQIFITSFPFLTLKKKNLTFYCLRFLSLCTGIKLQKSLSSVSMRPGATLKKQTLPPQTSTCSLKGNGLPNWCRYVFVEST